MHLTDVMHLGWSYAAVYWDMVQTKWLVWTGMVHLEWMGYAWQLVVVQMVWMRLSWPVMEHLWFCWSTNKKFTNRVSSEY